MRFYLGAHHADWLEKAGFPLFVSRRTLTGRKRMPRAIAPWALDSGGFTELSLNGCWATPVEQYAADVDRIASEAGMMEWAAPQDWMCEPWLLAKTGLSVVEHQKLTTRNLIQLRTLTREHIIPVIQGWKLEDYGRHVQMYAAEGIDLERESVVGIGSVCRRQSTDEIAEIIHVFSYLNLHGFGVKTSGLAKYGHMLKSADSMAWSYRARKAGQPLTGCVGHKNCANCLVFARQWREALT